MLDKSTFISVLIALAMTTGAAWADDTFTFTSTNDGELTSVGASTDDGQVGGSYWTGKTVATFADGSTSESTYTCMSMLQPPTNTVFMMHGVCDGSGADGDYTVFSGCNMLDAAQNETSCVGGLIGKTGKYKGRRGTVTIHGKAGGSTGTGAWYK